MLAPGASRRCWDGLRGMRLSAGAGTKGKRLYDWVYCELADLEADEYNENLPRVWTRGLLIRRSLTDSELAFFTTWCPAGTPIETLVAVEGRRWSIEDALETAKRSWVWRTTTLAPGTISSIFRGSLDPSGHQHLRKRGRRLFLPQDLRRTLSAILRRHWPDQDCGLGSVRQPHGGWRGSLLCDVLPSDGSGRSVAQGGVRSHPLGVVLPCADPGLRLP